MSPYFVLENNKKLFVKNWRDIIEKRLKLKKVERDKTKPVKCKIKYNPKQSRKLSFIPTIFIRFVDSFLTYNNLVICRRRRNLILVILMRIFDDGTVELLGVFNSEKELKSKFAGFVIDTDVAVTSDCFSANVRVFKI